MNHDRSWLLANTPGRTYDNGCCVDMTCAGLWGVVDGNFLEFRREVCWQSVLDARRRNEQRYI